MIVQQFCKQQLANGSLSKAQIISCCHLYESVAQCSRNFTLGTVDKIKRQWLDIVQQFYLKHESTHLFTKI